jgi:hypothetical protein
MPKFPWKWVLLAIAALLVFIIAPLFAVTECPMPQSQTVVAPTQVAPTDAEVSATDEISPTADTASVTVVLPVNTLLDTIIVRPGNCDSVWAALLLTVVAGAIGGMVFELLSLHGNVEMPHKYQDNESTTNTSGNSPTQDFTLAPYAVAMYMYDLGILARMLIGAMSALVVLLVVTPPDPVQLIAASIIAGSAGSSIFSLLRERLLATLAMNRAANLQMATEQVQENLAESESRLESVNVAYDQLRTIIDRLAEQGAPKPEADAVDGQLMESEVLAAETSQAKHLLQTMDAELARARRSLNEAQGISSSIRPPKPPEIPRDVVP